jgi:2-polyprenyl-3-methyl-5-hydroxy-6-metoxy-1,4-benzoquinol methylase
MFPFQRIHEQKMIRKVIKILYSFFIKTWIGSYFIKQYIILKYIRINRKCLVSKAAKTPWVCEFPYNIDRCIDYINEVFSDYFSKSGLSINDIAGKHVLEIGPGENLGVALKFLAAGADKVVCVDRFNSLLDENRQYEIYKRLLNELAYEEQERLKNIITIKDGKAHINSRKLQYLNVSVDKLRFEFQPLQFDFIISRAVLEHVLLIDSAMETMDLLLKHGGYMLHEIDFRDHGIFTSFRLPPLTFLSINDGIWQKMTSNIGAPNRRMLGYYQTYFAKKAYTCSTLFVRVFGSENSTVKLRSLSEVDFSEFKINKERKLIHPSCEITGVTDLKVAAAFYCARKAK